MAIQVHPERSGLHIKGPLQDILTQLCRVRMWAVIPDVLTYIDNGHFGIERSPDPCES